MPSNDSAALGELKRNLPAPMPGHEPPAPLDHGSAGLLRDYADQLKRKTPLARVNCAEFTDDPVPDLLTDIKRQLMRRCDPYPRLQFRRLELALAVTDQPINFRNHRAAQRNIKQAAKATFAPPSVSANAVTESGAVLGQVVPGTAQVPALIAGLYQARFPTLYSFYKWFGHRDVGEVDEPLDYLANLNRWAHPLAAPGPAREAELRKRDRALVAAFLADLRHAYGRGRLAKEQWYCCVALLTNADALAGKAFLARLHEVTEWLRRSQVEPAAFLVVTDRVKAPETGRTT
ncbi:hypothetical protein [Glycomyces sp. NPDC048151]|uniref:hypothetical protein n=1 Tax=Glycomyces sp. NPDC048151 TaxID=3364002 RepID=UPI00371DAC8E